MAHQWNLLTPSGLLASGSPEPGKGVWYSGRVDAILPLDRDTVLVGSAHGGVWLADVHGNGVALSDDWLSPDVRTLARGTRGPGHVYAGCAAAPGQYPGALFETDLTAAQPLFSWHEVPRLPANDIYAIQIVPGPDLIVLATDHGVWWSPVAVPPASYVWREVPGLPDGVYSGLALAQTSSGNAPRIVMAAWGANVATGHFGLFYADWDVSVPAFTPAQPAQFDKPIAPLATMMQRTSVASCARVPSRVYAIASGPNNQSLLAVLRSDDGGRYWKQMTSPNSGFTSQGLLNQALAVSPFQPDTVMMGWITGPHISYNGGFSWALPVDNTPENGMHPDVHALAYDPTDDSSQRFWVGTDGGVAYTEDGGKTYRSDFNRGVADLLFLRAPWGTYAGSSPVPGLSGGALQDNSNVYTAVPGAPWHMIEGGIYDGRSMVFLADGTLVQFTSGSKGPHTETWDGQSFADHGPIPNDAPPTDYPPGDADFGPKAAVVRQPAFRDGAGNMLVAVGGFGIGLYGLFATPNTQPTALTWRRLFAVPSGAGLDINGIGSFDGTTIFAGTKTGRLFSFTTASGQRQECTVASPNITASFQVMSPVIVNAALGLVLLADWSGPQENAKDLTLWQQGVLLWSRDLQTWEPVPNAPNPQDAIYAIAYDEKQEQPAVFVATDRSVFLCRLVDQRPTWTEVHDGLPARPHCSDLRVVEEKPGARWLYLATYGRSVFRMQLPPFVEAQGAVTAIKRDEHQVDVFVASGDGTVYTTYVEDHGPWNHPWIPLPLPVPSPSMPGGSWIEALKRDEHQLDIFVSAADRRVHTTYVTDRDPWSSVWLAVPNLQVVPGTPICALKRDDHQLDIFVTDEQQIVQTTYVVDHGAWNQNPISLPMPAGITLPPQAPVTAIKRDEHQLDIFVVGKDGLVYTRYVVDHDPWTANWIALPGVLATPGNRVTPLKRDDHQLDIFVVDQHGAVQTTFVTDHNPWNPLWTALPGITASPNASVDAIKRDDHQLDIFVTDEHGVVQTTFVVDHGAWNPGWIALPHVDVVPGAAIFPLKRDKHQLDLFALAQGFSPSTTYVVDHDPWDAPWYPIQ